MRVLVTGGTGFLGSHLIEKLLEERDVEVHALVRDPARLRWLAGVDRVHLLSGDLQNVPPLPAGLSSVFHLAGLTKTLKSSEYYTVNQKGTASLLQALDGQSDALRFVHLSSAAAGGPSTPRGPISEADPPRPLTPYGMSKLLAEEETLKYRDRFSIVILRLAAIYGPRDMDFLEYFRWVKRGILPLVGRRPKSLSLIFVRDAVRACLLAAKPHAPSGEVFNIADPKAYSWAGAGRIAAGLLGKKPIRVRFPYWSAYLAGAASEGVGRIGGKAPIFNVDKWRELKPDDWAVDVRKARERLGFETRFSLEQGFGETIAWYIWQGLL